MNMHVIEYEYLISMLTIYVQINKTVIDVREKLTYEESFSVGKLSVPISLFFDRGGPTEVCLYIYVYIYIFRKIEEIFISIFICMYIRIYM
jgi:hypothetical protein